MEIFKVENLSFTYPGETEKALDTVNFTARKGEFVLLCGKSGCGKTTLLRLLKPAISPHGEMCGSILFDGKEVSSCTAKEQAARIGFVMQNPDNQIVTDKVWHELAFGLESLGYNTPEIRTRVSEMASFFGIQSWFHQSVAALSGGQKQLLNLASVMVMQPSVLVLDEPTSQLDPIAADAFLQTLKKINLELGTTVILTEHRLEAAFPMADTVMVMDGGKIIAKAAPEEMGGILRDMESDMYHALPTPVRVHGAVSAIGPGPLSVRDGRVWLEEYGREHTMNPDAISADTKKDGGETVLEIRDAWFRYEKNLPDVIKGLNLRVMAGELYCIVGGNGTGKTTALSLLSGLYAPYRGKVFVQGKPIKEVRNLYDGVLGVLPQNPENVFLKKTVYLDLAEMLSDKKMTKEEQEEKLQTVSALCKLENILHRHPFDLSGGEKQRAALAKILLSSPAVLLLDEPTKGMDAHFKEVFAKILFDLKAAGTTIVMVSHDIEFCAEFADRCALFFDGAITSEGTPREFFGGKSFYTTAANRMARTSLPRAVLAEDIILALGGKVPRVKKTEPPQKTAPKCEKKEEARQIKPPEEKPKNKKRTAISALLLFLFIPLTIYLGVTHLGTRKYYFISSMIILETMLAFGISFESGKPKARELVLISVLCAVAVAGRAAFFMLPQFKPVIGLVIIAGVCFGGETGFLVGAVTAFVSNFFFGQGPWTPWQMFAFGSIGFVAGVLFKGGRIPKKRGNLCVFGFLSTLILYGGIMNPASVIMWQDSVTWKMLGTTLLVGFPLDMIHAISSVFFLWLLSEPMIEKLERVKMKYGFTRK